MDSATTSKDVNLHSGQLYSTRYWTLAAERAHLPIVEIKDQFIKALTSSSVIILEGRAGVGKSTQVPQWATCWAAGRGAVACSQARRAAAFALAARVAAEIDLAQEQVGFAIRDQQAGGSLLKYCTDGWLLREIARDPLLGDYEVVIVDDVNQRSLNTDVALALLKELLTRRTDLRIVIMGSGIDCDKWVRYFGSCAVITVPPPPVPIDIVYAQLPPSLTSLEAAIQTVVDLHSTVGDEGDILLFLATQEDVEKACELISQMLIGRPVAPLACIPLHSDLSSEELQKIPSPVRKCIVSTSIGETALIFDGVSFVVDSGLCQMDVYDLLYCTESPRVIPVSKATASRRAERAGVRAIRLYSEEHYERDFSGEDVPEMLRAAPERVERVLRECGIEGSASFDFIDRPTATRWDSPIPF